MILMRKHIKRIAAVALAAVALLQAPAIDSYAAGCTGWYFDKTFKPVFLYCSSPACENGFDATRYERIREERQCPLVTSGPPTIETRFNIRTNGCCD